MMQRKRCLGEAAVAAVLCGVMVVPPAVFADGPIPVETRRAALTPQEKTLHALNRLTFGPRPGDEVAVEKMGLEAWFQEQLHPERIDDAAFAAELGKFPAMRLSQAELMRRFPGQQEIRQMLQRGGGLPGDRVERAVWADAVASYEAQKKKVEAAAPAPTHDGEAVMNGAPGSVGGMNGASGSGGMVGSSSGRALEFPTHDGETVMNGAPGSVGGMNRAPRYGEMDGAAVQGVLNLDAAERFQRLVGMSPREMMQFRAALKPYERQQLMMGLTPEQMEVVAAMQGPARVVGAEVMETRLLRDVASQRQLQAVMTDFWLNHFSVYVKKNQNEVYYLPAYQNETILPNALGSFERLLVATAESPAMLVYLDNWESVGPDSEAATRVKRAQAMRPNGKVVQALPKGINENYARELMELHTLGVGGGYTQQDVIQVARCFTGWTIDKNYRDGGTGQFVFEPNRHEGGDKVVLGHVIPEGGMNEGLEVLHILATSPATARFVSTKLAVRFVSDDPPQALVDRMAATFLKTNGDIKAVLTVMFHSPEFWAPRVYRAKVKTPLEFLVSALRASDAEVRNPLPLVQAMEKLGMPVYGMQTPNGYSWKADEWVSSNALVGRMNFALVLSGGRLPGVQTDWAAELGGGTVVADAATERKLEMVILGQAASERTRETVVAQAADGKAVAAAEVSFHARKASEEDDDDAAVGAGLMMKAGYGRKGGGGGGFQAGPATALDTMAGLLLGSPDFQRR